MKRPRKLRYGRSTEELGLTIDPSDVLGTLDDYPTRSGFVITPIVVWGGRNVELSPDPREVAHVLQVGLHELCRADSPRFVAIPESDRPVVQLPIGRDLIHAPTGAVLLQFRWVAIEGRSGAGSTSSSSRSSPGASAPAGVAEAAAAIVAVE